MKRSISRTKQKQQNDIDFASVCCFKFLEFEFFEFLLIDAFWLIANSETENHWRHERRANDCEKNELNWLRIKFTLIVVFHFFMSCHCFRIVAVIDSSLIDVDCEKCKKSNACAFEIIVTISLKSMYEFVHKTSLKQTH